MKLGGSVVEPPGNSQPSGYITLYSSLSTFNPFFFTAINIFFKNHPHSRHHHVPRKERVQLQFINYILMIIYSIEKSTMMKKLKGVLKNLIKQYCTIEAIALVRFKVLDYTLVFSLKQRT